MIEIAALALTIGALMYRVCEHGITTAVVVGVGVCVLGVLVLRSVRGFLFGMMLGGCVVLGALALWQADTPVPKDIFGKRAFDATVISVDRRLDKTNIVVVDQTYDQKIQVSVPGKVVVLPGDTVSVRGEVVQPEDFVTSSGRIFGYQAYLASKGIVALAQNAVVGPVTSHTFSISRIPTKLRYAFADIFAKYVSFPFDGVLAGMVVGYQGGLPSSVQDLFRNTGVLHVLVLSGYNITLLAGFLAILLKGLPFKIRSVITIIAIVMIVLISGAGVASIRAGIMGTIAVFAGLNIRTYQPMRALVIAYLLFFFVSPTAIFVDPGFHLSFLATLFMILVLPKVERLFLFIPKTDHVDIRELLMLALTVPIFMLPYMMYFSGTFPIASPFANILFALGTPLIMVAGILLIALSLLPPIAAFVGTILSVFGNLLLHLLELCAKLPIWQTPSLPWWGVSGIYIVVLSVLFRRELGEFIVQRYTTLRQQSSSYS